VRILSAGVCLYEITYRAIPLAEDLDDPFDIYDGSIKTTET